MRRFIFTAVGAAGLLVGFGVFISIARAGECYADPIVEKSFAATVKRDVYVRDNPCTSGTTVLTTLSAGTAVTVSADQGGWYKVTTPSGVTGWSWGEFYTAGSAPQARPASDETCGATMEAYSGGLTSTELVRVRTKACTSGNIVRTISPGTSVKATAKANGWYKITLSDGTVGWSHGDYYTPAATTAAAPTPIQPIPKAFASYAGYFLVSKETKGLYFLNKQTGALTAISSRDDVKTLAQSGEPITSKNLERLPKAGVSNAQGKEWDYRTSMRGKIAIENGDTHKAWYIYPDTRRRYSLDVADRTLLVAHSLAKTISQADLVTIDPSVASDRAQNTSANVQEPSVVPAPTTASQSPSSNVSFDGLPGVLGVTTSSDGADDSSAKVEVKTKILFTSKGAQIAGTGAFQKGTVPVGFNPARINKYLVNRINNERTSRGQFPIVSDQRLIDTASVWASEMFAQGQVTHTRTPVNKIARLWAWENFKLDFAESWGWFYENIGGGSYDASTDVNASIERSLDKLIDYFISEEKDNGIHFQTIMHDHLTHLGVGFYFDGDTTGGKLYMVMHYAALAGRIPPLEKTL